MAERRMFSKVVLESDKFLNISDKSKLLYIYLGLEADDDGFIGSMRKLLGFVEGTQENVNELVNTGYLMKFESGVYLIRHWNANNYLRNDRYHETLYQDEKSLVTLNEKTRQYEWLSNGIPKVYREKKRQDETSQEESSKYKASEDEPCEYNFDDYGINQAFDNYEGAVNE